MEKDTAESKYQEASKLFAAGRISEAQQILEELAAAFPNNAQVRAALERCRAEQAATKPSNLSRWPFVVCAGVLLLAIAAGAYCLMKEKTSETRTAGSEKASTTEHEEHVDGKPEVLEKIVTIPNDDLSLSSGKVFRSVKNEGFVDPMIDDTFSIPFKSDYGLFSEKWTFKAEVKGSQIVFPKIVDSAPVRYSRIEGLNGNTNVWARGGTDYFKFLQPISSHDHVNLDIPSGKIYQYWLFHSANSASTDKFGTHKYIRRQVIVTGREVDALDERGRLLIVTERGISRSLEESLQSFMIDLVGDGWDVHQAMVSENDTVHNIKGRIQEVYDQFAINGLILIGNIPVPYSGDHWLDGHTEHRGAWPADGFYAELTGTSWTDDSVNITVADERRNHNVPGDGKFDQNRFDSDLEMFFGRIDLSEMPAFGSETELLAQYLRKLSAFKHGQLHVPTRAIISTEFEPPYQYSLIAWPTTSVVGREHVYVTDFSVPRDHEFLIAYGAGPGWQQGASGIVTVEDLQRDEYRAIFFGLFGSWFIDTDHQDNLIRAMLCQENYGLVAMNPDSTSWHIQYLGMGIPIGLSMQYTDKYSAGPHDYWVTKGLHGDPTLRMTYPRPIGSIEAIVGEEVELSWVESPEEVVEYRIYRSTDRFKGFERIGTTQEPKFVDPKPLEGKSHYMIRAVVLTESASGTYYNGSIGRQIDILKELVPRE